jgi:hypothetical protein
VLCAHFELVCFPFFVISSDLEALPPFHTICCVTHAFVPLRLLELYILIPVDVLPAVTLLSDCMRIQFDFSPALHRSNVLMFRDPILARNDIVPLIAGDTVSVRCC